jgi:hypothetical protein
MNEITTAGPALVAAACPKRNKILLICRFLKNLKNKVQL